MLLKDIQVEEINGMWLDIIFTIRTALTEKNDWMEQQWLLIVAWMVDGGITDIYINQQQGKS